MGNTTTKKYRVALIFSHPIHYLTAFSRELAARPDIELTVYLCSDFGLHPGYDATFGRTVTWYDERVLDGLSTRFLSRWFKKNTSPSGFWSVTNPGIVPELVRERYDAVMIHGYTYCTNWLAVITAKLVGTAVLLRGESNLIERRSVIVRAVKWVVLRTLFALIDRFLPIGTLNTRFYEHYGVHRDRLFLASYTVDNTRFQEERERFTPEREKLRRVFGVEDASPIILFVSKLIERKRPMDLLIAFEGLALQNRTPNPYLFFVGDGPERSMLERYTQQHAIKNVIFVGFKRPDELAPYFVMSDVFAFPSGFETWGLVVNEAMNFGLPIVTTDRVGSSYDLVQEGRTGFVYPAQDVDTLTKRLAALMSDQARRREIGEQARNYILTWSNREAVDGVLRALRSL